MADSRAQMSLGLDPETVERNISVLKSAPIDWLSADPTNTGSVVKIHPRFRDTLVKMLEDYKNLLQKERT